jgi:hypothetical protein
MLIVPQEKRHHQDVPPYAPNVSRWPHALNSDASCGVLSAGAANAPLGGTRCEMASRAEVCGSNDRAQGCAIHANARAKVSGHRDIDSAILGGSPHIRDHTGTVT